MNHNSQYICIKDNFRLVIAYLSLNSKEGKDAFAQNYRSNFYYMPYILINKSHKYIFNTLCKYQNSSLPFEWFFCYTLKKGKVKEW